MWATWIHLPHCSIFHNMPWVHFPHHSIFHNMPWNMWMKPHEVVACEYDLGRVAHILTPLLVHLLANFISSPNPGSTSLAKFSTFIWDPLTRKSINSRKRGNPRRVAYGSISGSLNGSVPRGSYVPLSCLWSMHMQRMLKLHRVLVLPFRMMLLALLLVLMALNIDPKLQSKQHRKHPQR